MTKLTAEKVAYLRKVGVDERTIKALEVALGAKAQKALGREYREKGGAPWRPVDALTGGATGGVKAMVLKGTLEGGNPTTWQGWDDILGPEPSSLALVAATNSMVKACHARASNGVPDAGALAEVFSGLDKRLAACLVEDFAAMR